MEVEVRESSVPVGPVCTKKQREVCSRKAADKGLKQTVVCNKITQSLYLELSPSVAIISICH